MVNILLKYQKPTLSLPTVLGSIEVTEYVESKVVVNGKTTDKTITTPVTILQPVNDMPIPQELNASDFDLTISVQTGNNLQPSTFTIESEAPNNIVDVVNRTVAQINSSRTSKNEPTTNNNNE